MALIYNGILLSHKKEWNCVVCRDVDGPRICQSEVSQKEKKIITYLKSLDFKKSSSSLP